MNERVVHFGPQGSLMGILTEPAEARAGAPALILINAGLLHRVGPNRLYVSIARRLAEAGFASLRFDLSGIGDSVDAEGELSIGDQVQRDVELAIDTACHELETRTAVVTGLCSGAYAAHYAALADRRVIGCVQLDGHIYLTRGFWVRHYLSRLLDLGAWLRLLRRVARPVGAAPHGPELENPFAMETVPRVVFERELGQLIEGGTELLFVLTSGGLLPVNYGRQLHDSVPGVDLDRSATVHYMPAADHTFTLSVHRAELMDVVAGWLDRTFPRATIPGPSSTGTRPGR